MSLERYTQWSVVIAGSISVVSSVALFVLILLWKIHNKYKLEPKTFLRHIEEFLVRFVVQVGLAVTMSAITYIWGSLVFSLHDSLLCKIQGVMLLVFEDSSILWTAGLAIMLFFLSSSFQSRQTETVKQKTLSRMHSLEKICMVICWVAPLLLAMIATLNGWWAEKSRGWCYLRDEWMEMAFFYIPLVVLTVFVVLLLITALLNYRRVKIGVIHSFTQVDEETKAQWGHGEPEHTSPLMPDDDILPETLRDEMLKGRNLILGYLIVFMALWTWPFVNSVLTFSGENDSWSNTLATASETLLGFGNFLVFAIVYYGTPAAKWLRRSSSRSREASAL